MIDDVHAGEHRSVHRPHPIMAVVDNYEWLHTSLGLAGNLAFLVGSVFFLDEDLKTAGVWLFIVGAAGMLLGSIGRAIADVYSDE